MEPFKDAGTRLFALLCRFAWGFAQGCGWTSGIIYGFKIMGVLG